MASTKQNDAPKSMPADAIKGHGLSLSNSKFESYSGISDENERNSNLSPSKSADPARKKTFKITSVKKGATGNGDVGGDNDADSIDGLDESQTEDLSSEFYDSSKATDLDMDLQDFTNTPLTPDELTSTTTTIVVKQKPDQNSQSRFKVVKIETKEPFRRGKWVCYDFFDTAPPALVTVERNDSRVSDDSIIQSALAGNLSSLSSVHYVQDVNDSSSNIFIPPVVPMSPQRTDRPMLSDVFVPIQPAPATQVLSQLDGLTSDAMAPFIAQQVLMSVANVPSTSASFHNLAQTGHTTMIQNLPQTGLFPFPQNGSQVSLFQNGVAGHSSKMIGLPSDAILGASASLPPSVIAPPSSVIADDLIHSQASLGIGGIPHSHSQTQIRGDLFAPPGIHLAPEAGLSSAPRLGPAPLPGVTQPRIETSVFTNATDAGDHMGLEMDRSTDSIKTLQGNSDGQTSEGLKEAVEAVGEMYMGLEASEDDADESGGSTVAIDNKIEQAMDLVKRHLMYAVREEVEILKQQIGEMMERIGQLEYENSILRSEAKPETLSKLQQPRLPQSTPQAVLPSQPQPQTASVLLTPAPQHPAVPQVQPSQQQPTAVSQVGQPPSTT
ncbi:hypothetical protein BsWGS_03536 [Bradybaena similaris]